MEGRTSPGCTALTTPGRLARHLGTGPDEALQPQPRSGRLDLGTPPPDRRDVAGRATTQGPTISASKLLVSL